MYMHFLSCVVESKRSSLHGKFLCHQRRNESTYLYEQEIGARLDRQKA